MSHKKLRPFIVKVSVLGYFPILIINIIKKVDEKNNNNYKNKILVVTDIL